MAGISAIGQRRLVEGLRATGDSLPRGGYRAYVYDLGDTVEGSRRLLWGKRAAGWPPTEGEEVLLLGYAEDLDLFAAWPWQQYRDAPPGSPPRIEESYLLRAREIGRTRVSDEGSPALAFRPDRIRSYLNEVEAGWRSHPSSIPHGDAPWVKPSPSVPSMETGKGIQLEEFAIAHDLSVHEEVGAPPEEEPPKEVETGFAELSAPADPIHAEVPLQPGRDYFFWLAVGAETGASIETSPAPLPEDLPAGARLTVRVVGFAGELQPTGEVEGELEVLRDGGAAVVARATTASDDETLHEQRLFFPVRAPMAEQPDVYHLRCNLYYRSTLIQSRLVSAQVGGEAAADRPVLATDLDYALSGGLAVASLERVGRHDISVIAAPGGLKGSHQIAIFASSDAGQGDAEAKPQFSDDGTLEPSLVESLIRMGRETLRELSWGSRDEAQATAERYRYATTPSLETFTADLARLAVRGRQIYLAVTGSLDGGVPARPALEGIARRPVRVQIATLVPGSYIPAALFYDYPLELTAPAGALYRLCKSFATALELAARSKLPLPEDDPCLNGECPQREDKMVVCPGGFWGFRHRIGWPVGIAEPITEVGRGAEPRLGVGISTDSQLTDLPGHAARVQAMGQGWVATSRDEFERKARLGPAHVVYLYGHGGETEMGIPYIEIGPRNSPGISSGSLADAQIYWGEPPPRPIVFVNGCHTTALAPGQVLDLVAGFVKEANAIGVLGTELTVFEPLAGEFAETVLDHYLKQGTPIGEAVRQARLKLLCDYNPLGLAYVPFVAAETRLV